MSHGTHVKQSRGAQMMSLVTHMDGSWHTHTYGWVMAHTYGSVMAHTYG